MKEDEIEITEVYDKKEKMVRQYLNYGRHDELLVGEIPVGFSDYVSPPDWFK